MSGNDPVPPHLFTLRLWVEPVGEHASEWRGKIQHIQTGETRYFRSWEDLVQFVEGRLEAEKEGTERRPNHDGPGARGRD